MAKLILRVPTRGKKVGDEIDVSDKETADRLIQSGTARKAPARAEKSEKG